MYFITLELFNFGPKKQIRYRTGIDVERQRLVYLEKTLEDTRDGDVMTFQHYRITGSATILLLTRLSGSFK